MPTVVPAGFWNVRYWPVGILTESNLQPKVSSRNFLVSLRFVLASSVNAIAPGVLDLLESFPLFIGRDMSKKKGERGLTYFPLATCGRTLPRTVLRRRRPVLICPCRFLLESIRPREKSRRVCGFQV